MELDLILVVLVLGALIFFSVLLSIGNERQRRAIDGIRVQAARWAEQDLRLKRERAGREISVEDPLAWLSHVAGLVTGAAPALTRFTTWSGYGALAVVAIGQDGRRLVLTPLEADQFLAAAQPGRAGGLAGRLLRSEASLLGERPKRVPRYELSIVTVHPFFDLEAARAWQAMTGLPLTTERLTLFDLRPER